MVLRVAILLLATVRFEFKIASCVVIGTLLTPHHCSSPVHYFNQGADSMIYTLEYSKIEEYN
jgi:hypothetical protein